MFRSTHTDTAASVSLRRLAAKTRGSPQLDSSTHLSCELLIKRDTSNTITAIYYGHPLRQFCHS